MRATRTIITLTHSTATTTDSRTRPPRCHIGAGRGAITHWDWLLLRGHRGRGLFGGIGHHGRVPHVEGGAAPRPDRGRARPPRPGWVGRRGVGRGGLGLRGLSVAGARAPYVSHRVIDGWCRQIPSVLRWRSARRRGTP